MHYGPTGKFVNPKITLDPFLAGLRQDPGYVDIAKRGGRSAAGASRAAAD